MNQRPGSNASRSIMKACHSSKDSAVWRSLSPNASWTSAKTARVSRSWSNVRTWTPSGHAGGGGFSSSATAIRQYVRTGRYPRSSRSRRAPSFVEVTTCPSNAPGPARSTARRSAQSSSFAPRPELPVLGLHVDVDVVVADEGGVRGEPAVHLDDDGIVLEVEPGHVPVREQVVELEVGCAELVDVAGDDEVRHGLGLVAGGGAHGLHGVN